MVHMYFIVKIENIVKVIEKIDVKFVNAVKSKAYTLRHYVCNLITYFAKLSTIATWANAFESE